MNSKSLTLCVFYSIIIAGIYFVSALATKPLILPPTFAAPIWPTAGIGIGVVILWGYRYIPAILLGELLTYIQFYNKEELTDLTSLFLTYSALLLATVVRTTLGAYLVNRHLGKSNNYLTLQAVIKLLLFAGIIPTFISSFIATFALYSNNIFYIDSWLINFLTWWFGDVVGVCVILPIMFLLFKKPRNIWQPRLLKTTLPVLITFTLLIIVTYKFKQLEVIRLNDSLESKIELINNAVMHRFNQNNPTNFQLSSSQSVQRVDDIYKNELDEIIQNLGLSDIHFDVSSIVNTNENKLFESENNFSKFEMWKASKEVIFAENRWKISACPTSEYFINNSSWLIWWLTSIGFVFIAILGSGLLVITGSQILIKDTVVKRTNEIKTLNEILKQSERRYKQLIEIQPVIFWKHIRGEKNLDFVSNEGINILGYSKKDLVNVDLIWNKLIHPEDRSKTLLKYQQGIESNQRFVLKYRVLAKNGTIIWFKDYVSTRKVNGKKEVIGLKIDITKEQLKQQEIVHLAYYDSLTDLPNRLNFMFCLQRALRQSIKEKTYGAILFLDLDRFKVLNDSMGHHFGDKLLVQISQRLQSLLNKEDIIARFGGDEFVILLAKQAQSLDLITQKSLDVAQKIQNLFKQHFNIDGHNFFTTFSTGISIFPHNSNNPDEIIQQADIAMYASKEKGKNTVSFFKDEMQQLANKKLMIEKSLKLALIRHEFEMYYQPIFDQNKKTLKLESLIRWNHPTEKLVSPDLFIHIAEETGFIIELSDWIIDNVIEQVSKWKKANFKILEVSINMSLFQFNNAQTVEMLKTAIKKYKIDSHLITIELTESIAVGDFNEVLLKLNNLKKMGFKIAIDDFGTGYSSLNYLSQMPIDTLKLDQSFVANIGKKQNSDSLIETIVLMAKQLNLELIIEGVETEQQFTFLKKLGCTKFQGFLVNKAMSVKNLEKIMKDQ